MMNGFADFSRRALVPEHLEHYVRALGPCTPLRVGECLGWRSGTSLILAAFPKEQGEFFRDPGQIGSKIVACAKAVLEETVARALAFPWLADITVLAPARPSLAPGDARVHEDIYYGLDLPPVSLSGKTANMLRRAKALCRVAADDPWSSEHDALLSRCVTRMRARQGDRQLSPRSALLFSRIKNYATCRQGQAVLYSARRLDNNALCGLALGDHCSYTTSFYLFAFRSEDAPQGTADALLHALFLHSSELGQCRCNLGLGVNDGITFFKTKWGARPWFPLVECSWQKPRKSFFARVFGR